MVSTDFPPSTAQMEEPFPRWQTMTFRSFGSFAKDFSHSLGYETVAGSVEAVTSYSVLFIIFIWKSIQICFLRHGLMECCIKYAYHRYVRHQFLTCIDTDQVCRIVKRRQIVALLNLSQILHRVRTVEAGKFFSAMYHYCDPLHRSHPVTEITPFFSSVSSFSTRLTAAVWLGIAVLNFYFILAGRAYGSDGHRCRFSHTDLLPVRASVSESISWYFNDELPQLITKTFILYTPPVLG